ncbi:MAG: hypothetical protein HY094_09410 [Candidatus Melainabacteria bacterium]|nr:hypothetical protein [Candidatus Melainabacteria bacterium]
MGNEIKLRGDKSFLIAKVRQSGQIRVSHVELEGGEINLGIGQRFASTKEKSMYVKGMLKNDIPGLDTYAAFYLYDTEAKTKGEFVKAYAIKDGKCIDATKEVQAVLSTVAKNV